VNNTNKNLLYYYKHTVHLNNLHSLVETTSVTALHLHYK